MKLTKTYPYFKSGMTFNWGALLGYAAVDFVGIEGAIFSSLFVRVMNHVLGWFEGQLHWIVDVDLKNGDKEFLFSPVG